VLAVALGLCAWFLADRRQALSILWQRAEIGPLAAATGTFVVFVFVQVRVSVYVLQAMGARVGTLVASRVVLLSLFGRYVPGKIWVVTLRTGFLDRHGVSPTTALASVVTEHLFLLATGGAMFAIAVYLDSAAAGAGLLIVTGLVLVTLVALPRQLLRGVSGLLRRVRLPTPGEGLNPRRALVVTVAYCGSWLVLGTGIWLLALGLGLPLPPRAVVSLAGHYGIAVIGGLLAVFAPAGVGVREGIFTAAMSGHLSATDALFLALAVRLCVAVAELVATGLAYAMPVRAAR